jgi:hypothetical protein
MITTNPTPPVIMHARTIERARVASNSYLSSCRAITTRWIWFVPS